MQFILIGLLAASITLAGTANAYAAPITIALFGAAFAATTAGAIVTFAISTAISIGLSLVAQALTKKDAQRQSDPGVTFDVQMGDTVPVGFPIGQTATAGSREYIGAWGAEGGTPNAYLVDVLTISDIPLPGQPGLWLADKLCTILWEETPVEQGYPISEFRVGGVDYAWIKYNDGTQVSADSYLLSKFGSDPDRPWTSDMIGRGCAFVIITTLINRDLFSGEPRKLIEPPVARLYDLRKDSTAGGSGAHRWDDQSTWEASSNPMVAAYNVARGIYFGSEWIFGGQNLAAFRLPAANWIAAANACDEDVDLGGGGTEPAFRCGIYVTGDLEPLAVIDELRKACNATIAEDGGIFRAQVGEPASAVYAFTDDDILVTEGQSYEPFPNLDNTNNIIEGTYPEPREQWKDKDAPQRRNEDAIAEDGDRELIASVRYTAAPYANQVQRLMDAALKDERRFRVHSFWLPPDAWALSAGTDRVSWSSARNGYSNKKFKIVRITGRRNSNQLVMLKEVDASDFDWDTEFELPEATGVIGPLTVPPQPMTGWQAFADYLQDAGATKQRPSIRVEFSATQVDVRAVRVQARIKASGDLQFDAEIPYEDVPGDPKAVILNGVFLPATEYEVRGKFIAYSARQTEWSEWLTVTTPSVSEVDLPAEIYRMMQLVDELGGRLRVIDRMLADISGAVQTDQALLEEYRGQLNRGIGSRYQEVQASVEQVMQVATSATNALAQYFVGVSAETAGNKVEALFRMIALSDLAEGYLARVALQVRADTLTDFAEAALELGVVSTPGGPKSIAILKGDNIFLEVEDAVIPVKGLRRADEVPVVPIVSGSPNTVRADLGKRHVAFQTNLTANLKYLLPLNVSVGDSWLHTFKQAGGFQVTFDPLFFIQGLVEPQADPTADSESVFRFYCSNMSPPKVTVQLEQSGNTAYGSVTMLSINPPINGVSIYDLNEGDLVIEGPYTGEVTALGQDGLECDVEGFGPGGSVGGLSFYDVSNPGNVTDAAQGSDTTFDGMTAGAGKPSLSKRLVTGVFGSGTPGGLKGLASGPGTNVDGNNGEAGGYISLGEYYAYAGYGAAAPSPGGAQVPGNFTGGTLLAIAGNFPGGGARGPAYRGSPSPPQIDGIGGGGSGAKFTRRYNSAGRLTGTKSLVVGESGNAGIGLIANGARGGNGRVKFSKIP